jgi:hypothetical protein
MYVQNTIVNDAIIDSRKSFSLTKQINEKKQISLVINSIPEGSLVNVVLKDPKDIVIQDSNFSKEISKSFNTSISGSYSVNITNLSSDQVTANVFFGYLPILKELSNSFTRISLGIIYSFSGIAFMIVAVAVRVNEIRNR